MVMALPLRRKNYVKSRLLSCKQASHARRHGEGIARLHRGEFLQFPPIPCKQAKHRRRHGEDLAKLHRGEIFKIPPDAVQAEKPCMQA